MEETLRNLLTATAVGLLLALCGTSAANAANPNVPASSPYALLEVPSSGTPHRGPDYGEYRSPEHGTTERRAAYAGAGEIYGRPGNDYGPGYEYPSPASPYKWAVSPEDFR
jgi:hypothetical protein